MADATTLPPAPPSSTTTLTTTSHEVRRGFTPVTLSILCGLLVILAVLVTLVAWQWFRQEQQRRRLLQLATQHFYQRHHSHSASAMAANLEERIQRRYETVEHWLITKRVQAHDPAFCRRVLEELIPNSPKTMEDEENQNGTSTTAKHKSNDDTKEQQQDDDEEEEDTKPDGDQDGTNGTDIEQGVAAPTASDKSNNIHSKPSALPVTDADLYYQDSSDDNESSPECPICMNEFGVGDLVSWSANTHPHDGTPICQHVYHHECIKEWLLRRTHCPYCRQTFLPCDTVLDRQGRPLPNASQNQQQQPTPKTPEQLQEMSTQYAAATSRMYYDHVKGLICLPPLIRCTVSELDRLKQHIFSSMVRPEDLVTKRGERQEGNLATLQKEMNDNSDGGNDTETNDNGGDCLDASENPLPQVMVGLQQQQQDATLTNDDDFGEEKEEEQSAEFGIFDYGTATDRDDDNGGYQSPRDGEEGSSASQPSAVDLGHSPR